MEISLFERQGGARVHFNSSQSEINIVINQASPAQKSQTCIKGALVTPRIRAQSIKFYWGWGGKPQFPLF